MLRFVFAYLLVLRMRRGVELPEAAHIAVLFMTMPIIAMGVMADLLSAYALGREPLLETVGKWPFGVAVLLLSYGLLYLRLIRGRGLRTIAQRYDASRRRPVLSALIVSIYLFGLPLVSIAVGVSLAR